MATIFNRNLEVENFVQPCFHVAVYKRAYQHFVNPMDGIDMWPKQGLSIVHPSHYHKQPERPKTLKRRELDEPSQNVSKLKMNYLVMKYRTCGKQDHNKITCKSRRGSNKTQL